MLVLEADERKWEEGIKELRDWYKQDTANVRELFCKIPESPGDGVEGDAYAAQIADRTTEILKELKGKKKKSELDGKLEVFRSCFDDSAETVKLEPELRVYE